MSFSSSSSRTVFHAFRGRSSLGAKGKSPPLPTRVKTVGDRALRRRSRYARFETRPGRCSYYLRVHPSVRFVTTIVHVMILYIYTNTNTSFRGRRLVYLGVDRRVYAGPDRPPAKRSRRSRRRLWENFPRASAVALRAAAHDGHARARLSRRRRFARPREKKKTCKRTRVSYGRKEKRKRVKKKKR